MLGERTCTSAMSGAATNTVEAGPGSLSAVPLLTSSVSVGGSVGTIWLWANGRPGAPPVTAGWLRRAGGRRLDRHRRRRAQASAPGRTCGRGAAGCGCSTIGGGAAAGGGETRSGWPRSTPGVSAALAIGARGGMAATVGGRESTGVTAASSAGATATAPERGGGAAGGGRAQRANDRRGALGLAAIEVVRDIVGGGRARRLLGRRRAPWAWSGPGRGRSSGPAPAAAKAGTRRPATPPAPPTNRRGAMLTAGSVRMRGSLRHTRVSAGEGGALVGVGLLGLSRRRLPVG